MGTLAVFAYNFPHRKTQDFLFRLFVEGISIDYIFAADPVKLNIPPSEVRTKVRHHIMLHPHEIAKAIGAEYHTVAHDGPEIDSLVCEIQPDIGLISGARILKLEIIERFSTGIINFHPGLIPESRGLDALLWSVRNDIPLGVTSHLIDHRVDAGKILERRRIDLFEDDTVFDLSERLYETQLEMLVEAISRARKGIAEDFDFSSAACNSKMTGAMERETLAMLPEYLNRHITNEE